MTTLLIFAIAFIVFLACLAYINKEQQKDDPEGYQRQQDFRKLEKHELDYFYGHPDLDEPKQVFLAEGDGEIRILARGLGVSEAKQLAGIPCSAIKAVDVEDQSSIDRRVTLGRLALVGIFALAWKKEKVNEAGYLIISWSDGRFEHETFFRIKGATAIARINTIRNKVMRWAKSADVPA